MSESIRAEGTKKSELCELEVENVEERESHNENAKYPTATTAIFQPIFPREEHVMPSLRVRRRRKPHPITTTMDKQRATVRVITPNSTLMNAMAVE